MKIIFFVVNYKADDHVFKMIESVLNANKDVNFDITIHVIDNSIKSKVEEAEFRKSLQANGASLYSSTENLGYFGCIPIAQSLIENETFDCVIYCNPDLCLDVNFLKELTVSMQVKGIIAPSIISKTEGFDQNPKYLSKLSRSKMIRLKLIYSNILTYFLFFSLARVKELLFVIKKRSTQSNDKLNQIIYAPHGAMFIFTDASFFKGLEPYPCFLFGEEIFIAEEAEKAGVKVYYTPNVKVYDSRHASISSLGNNFRRKLYYKSISYLLKNYY
jgi:GT2 family glycosyltransferase